jgi:2-polyprenyl-3-methyl-5-hydroxy-6-metoxy-1,4-benzoquinol methylase
MSNYTANKYIKDENTPWHKIIQNINNGSKVLDIGCSSGNLGKAIKTETKSTVVGVEIDRLDAKRAAKVLDAVYAVNLETEAMPAGLAKQQFDYIIFCDVIEHLVWPAETLQKIKSLLKPNGKVLFCIPNMTHMSVRLMLLGGKFDYGETGILDKTHLHFYDKEEIYRVFADAGYFISSFEWVSQAIQPERIKNRLNKLGLVTKQAFFDKDDIGAVAYQYVGAAVPMAKPPASKRRPNVSPDIEAYIQTVRNQLAETSKQRVAAPRQPKISNERLKKLTADHIRNLEILNEKQSEQIDELSRALDSLNRHKIVRIARSLNHIRPGRKKDSRDD